VQFGIVNKFVFGRCSHLLQDLCRYLIHIVPYCVSGAQEIFLSDNENVSITHFSMVLVINGPGASKICSELVNS